MTITVKDIKTIKADLVRRYKARLTVTDDRDLSVKETTMRLAPELRRMKKRGFTTTEMIEALKENGLNIKGATLNRYLAEGQSSKINSGYRRRKSQEAAPQSDQKSYGTNAADPPSPIPDHQDGKMEHGDNEAAIAQQRVPDKA